MKKLFGYIRVSTARQGEHGVSLTEQRDAIERYAQKNTIEVCQWFEERVTAAKRGRPVFNDMMKLLRDGQADGIVIHKIDRGARNLKDWSDLGELIDQGVEVHFANESLDLHSRGGRLSADIQAVVAADYIRNLREETKKGFYGRLKQGLYPLPAPIGYLDRGGGKVKDIDPARAPHVRAAFELYAKGTFNLETLGEELWRRGLRNRRGGPVTLNGVSQILNNPFYIGIIRLESTKETYAGVHQPLIRKSLFDRVHSVLTGKFNARTQKHEFVYRRLIKCASCGFSIIGELRKSHVYYRCHTPACRGTCVREEAIVEAVAQAIRPIVLDERERRYAASRIDALTADWRADQEAQVKALDLQQVQLNERLAHLTDAFIEGLIDRSIFEERKNAILLSRKDFDERKALLLQQDHLVVERLNYILELCGAAYLLHKAGLPEEQRILLETVTSNRSICQKSLVITLAEPFLGIANRPKTLNSSPSCGTPRTLETVIDNLVAWLRANPDRGFDRAHDLVSDKYSAGNEERKTYKLAA